MDYELRDFQQCSPETVRDSAPIHTMSVAPLLPTILHTLRDMNPTRALSNADEVLSVANRFFHIADLLHRRLGAGALGSDQSPNSTDLYSLLVEEYGLRARAAILRNNSSAHTVSNTTIDQASLLRVLDKAGEAIACIKQLEQLRSVISSVSTLCVCINPGKGHVVDFLAAELLNDLQRVLKV